MTEKRFHSEDDCVGYYTEIIDEQKKLDLTISNPKKNLVVEELVDLLNALNDENEQLKQKITELENDVKHWKLGFFTMIHEYNEMEMITDD